MITSIHNPKVKQFQQWLVRGKARRESGRIVLEGVRLIEAAILAGYSPELVLFSKALNERGRQLLTGLERTEIIEVDSSVLEKVSDTETSQGILASLPMFEIPLPAKPELLLLLDRLQDPGNAGTLLRSALGAGAQGVIFSQGSVDPFSPKVLRAAMGAHFHLPIRTLSIHEIDQQFHDDIQTWVTDAVDGMPYWQVDYRQPLMLAIGSEAGGISTEIRAMSVGTITIPITDGIESLNAAIAGSIILFEARRQRMT
ncbi:MAG: RNA methyltransferase [Anaerolineae bacterium]|nr:RNA methyltransferase [Anaerolineae bacterium]